MRSLILTLVTMTGLLPGALHAQRVVGPPFPSVDRPAPLANPSLSPFPREETNPGLLAAGGVVGAVAGMFAGALVGGKLTENDCEDCGLAGVVYGGIIGGSAGLPFGVHLVNHRQGSFGLSLLSSLAIGGLGLAMAAETNSGAIMLPVPVLQVVSSILIERRTEK
jgi:hypothetical protein